MTSVPGATDGRTSRSRRTGEAIVTALVTLILDGDPSPTAQRIAESAGVSVRSVYGHYASLDELHRAAVERVTTMVIERLAPIDPDEGLTVRIDQLCRQRARINEELGPLLKAAEQLEQTSPEIAQSRRFGRRASREQLERIFATELDVLEPGARRRRVASVEALLSTHSWKVLRHGHKLAPDDARIALGEAVQALLER